MAGDGDIYYAILLSPAIYFLWLPRGIYVDDNNGSL